MPMGTPAGPPTAAASSSCGSSPLFSLNPIAKSSSEVPLPTSAHSAISCLARFV
jgi:hypothetical protein